MKKELLLSLLKHILIVNDTYMTTINCTTSMFTNLTFNASCRKCNNFSGGSCLNSILENLGKGLE